MTFKEFKDIVVAQCQEMGIAEYELYYQAGSSTTVDTFQHGINEFTSSETGGVCFRCIVNGKMGYASTEDLSAEQAKAVVAKAVDSASVLESEEQVFLAQGGQTIHYNVLNVETLKDAKAHPENYPNLQVRVCGWNADFTKMIPKEQDDFIRRAELQQG